MTKKVIIWTTGIDNIESSNIIGGLTVQMSIWASTFSNNGWLTYSFTTLAKNHGKCINDINYIHLLNIKHLNVFLEILNIIKTLITIRPELIIFRGASRTLLSLSLLSKFFGSKVILMFASNSDLEIGNELINRPWDKYFYRIGLKYCYSYVVQNKLQSKLLEKQYNKHKYIDIPNIWISNNSELTNQKKEIILWVSNFRELKRPSLFIELAKCFPFMKFVMIGAMIDKDVYQDSRQKADKISNLEFKGSQTLSEVNKFFSITKLFVCTSKIEGFPNTFLQAWSNNIPVVSTFDPDNIISEKGLGLYVTDIESLKNAILKLNDLDLYKSIQKNIKLYYKDAHNPQIHYTRLMHFLETSS